MSAFENTVPLVRSAGVLLFDADGEDHLDAAGSPQSVGHGNQRVTDAIAASAASLGVPSPQGDSRGGRYAMDLLATFPATLHELVFTCSASEANDLALRTARAVTGGRGVIVSRNAYHGNTTETASISPARGSAATVPGWVRVVDPPTGDGSGFAASVGAAARDLADSEYGLCALVFDPAFTSDGFVVDVPLTGAAAVVREAGGLVISDETLCGFGRLGTGMWGFESTGIVPDLVTIGKSMGNGMSVAAMISGSATSAVIADGAVSSSTAGDAVSIAAAQAVLDCIRDDDLVSNAHSVGDYLRMGVELLASAGDALGAVRGSGMVVAVDVIGRGAPDVARATALVDELARRRILVSTGGLHGNVILIRPQLICTIADVDRLLEQLYGAILVVDPSELGALSADATTPGAESRQSFQAADDQLGAPDATDAVEGEPDAEDVDPDPIGDAER